MANRKTNLLITMIFDKDLDMRKQIDTEFALKNRVIEDLQRLITSKEITSYAIADDEVIDKKLTEERKTGQWIDCGFVDKGTFKKYKCSNCSEFVYEKEYLIKYHKYCLHCGSRNERC